MRLRVPRLGDVDRGHGPLGSAIPQRDDDCSRDTWPLRSAFCQGARGLRRQPARLPTRSARGSRWWSTADPVVDLWGGHADPARTRPWERDTIVNVYSSTKGMTALCAHRLVDRGPLDLDAPVARYWPEFAQRGQGRDPGALAARAPRRARRGADASLPGEALYDWDAMCAALAAETPWWDAGHGARLPRRHVRLAGRRGGAAHRRAQRSAPTSATRSPQPLGAGLPHRPAASAEHARVAEMSRAADAADQDDDRMPRWRRSSWAIPRAWRRAPS